MDPYKDWKAPRHSTTRPHLRLRFVLALALVAGAALAGPAPTPTNTPVPPWAFDLPALTADKWERIVENLEGVAMGHPDAKERQLAAWTAHLAREGRRLGKMDGATKALSDHMPKTFTSTSRVRP